MSDITAPTVEAAVIRAYLDAEPVTEILRRFEISKSTLARIRERHGIATRSSTTKRGRVPVAPFRAAFLRERPVAGELARDLGFMRWDQPKDRPNPRYGPDRTRLLRVLGLKPQHSSNLKKQYYNTTISEAYAEKLLGHLGLDPVDVGL